MGRHFRWVLVGLMVCLGLAGLRGPVQAQDCGDAPVPRLVAGVQGQVTYSNGQPLNVRNGPTLGSPRLGSLPEGAVFAVVEGPFCNDNIYWWHIQANDLDGWAAEGQAGAYFVEPVSAASGPAIPAAASGVPQIIPPATSGLVAWDWAAFNGGTIPGDLPDPAAITPPPVYAGDMPALPVDSGAVQFIADTGLNPAQLALLAQNGFVVVPGGFAQFEDAYQESEQWSTTPPGYNWEAPVDPQPIGHAFFVTTDAMLHSLHYVFDNLLTDLELNLFYPQVQAMTIAAYQTARAQVADLAGTALEEPASAAALYLAVGVGLLAPDQFTAVVDTATVSAARPILDLIQAGTEQAPLAFLPGYTEDFSQYRPRGHYAGDPSLEAYFRGMNWLSRITFRASETRETQIALLLLRALSSTPTAVQDWSALHDMLSFLIGPSDDLGPPEYSALAAQVFGAELPTTALVNGDTVAAFQAQVAALPGPRVNGLILPPDTNLEDVATLTRGFRLMGQRFTFDGYVLGQLMYPYVGTREVPRSLPSGLDVAAADGSQVANDLLAAQGVPAFANYDSQLGLMRQTLAGLTPADWLENIYGGWLWTLQPLWNRDPAPYPPLMQTDAWLRRDLQAGLGSYTELKHDTVLYVKQPTGFGGGGAPLFSYGYVEPNPLVFARIAVVAASTYRGLQARGVSVNLFDDAANQTLAGTMSVLRDVAIESAHFAEMARRELTGQALSDDDYYRIQDFRNFLDVTLRSLYMGEGQPDPVALVTDIANDGVAQVLQQAVGGVDTIYVVVPDTRGGLQVVRGGVFSYYEFVGSMSQRMTDAEWRAQVAAGDTPPRPDWVSAFFSE